MAPGAGSGSSACSKTPATVSPPSTSPARPAASSIPTTSAPSTTTTRRSLTSWPAYRPATSSLVCQVILIGHSAGGLSVVHAMHLFGDRIKQAIFIAATMLQFGYQTEQDIKDGVPDLSEYGDVYDLTFGLGADRPPTAVALRKEFQRIILYQQSPQEDSALASILLRPWPTALSTARFTGDDGGVESFIDRVRRVYIKTANDRMVQPEQQEAMIRRWPPSKVMVMDTDQSPFFSAPELLFNLILKSL
ncbi:methylesterase 17 isoform X2 [Oryza sativa Japonica Group]|uniref:methylesterase 17 isoform X2 n=1 Tax=Oryza sativa subsp. japonica TaxID=39947 RepID=UPI0007753BE1|nr:hypothetical protein DAI22_11g009300 [Oryza sativa Japonica Group]KAF2909202.1 hypothetical protein DAI22_11g009300 [Oryza sativa Japonica Group]